MDDQVNRPAPRDVTDVFDANLRDLASGALSDARSMQTEPRRTLADYNRAHPDSSAGQAATPGSVLG